MVAGRAEVGQVDRCETGAACAGGARHGATGGAAGSTAVAPRRIVTVRSASVGSHGPTSPSGHVTRTSVEIGGAQAEVQRHELPARVAATDRHLALDLAAAHPDRHPGADRVVIGRVLVQVDCQPVTHRRRLLGRAGAHIAPQADGLPPYDQDEVELAVEVEVDQRRPASAVVVDDAGLHGALDERPVRLPDEEVARVLARVLGLHLDVALADEQVAEPVVVDVLERRVPRGGCQRLVACVRIGAR